VAIEFTHNGRIWRADTTEEAIKLRQQLEAEDDELLMHGELPSVVEDNKWTPDTAVDLLKGCGRLQKQFLKLLHERGQFMSTDEIVKVLKIDSGEALAGVLSGLSKQLKKLEKKPSDLYSVEVEWGKEGKIRRFQMTHGFRWATEQLGWPEAWI
jgi:hypothetical protein